MFEQTEVKSEIREILEKHYHSVQITKVEISEKRITSFIAHVFKCRVSGIKGEKNFSESFVVKTIPRDPVYVDTFNCNAAFRNENKAYSEILPNLNKFSSKILAVPRKIYSSDNLIILEDLAEKDFDNLSPTSALNVGNIKLIISEIANLHSASIRLQNVKPELFKSLTSKVEEVVYRTDKKLSVFATQERAIEIAIRLVNCVKTKEMLQDMKQNVMELQLNLLGRPSIIRVLNHRDLWLNNFLMADSNVKLIDFQGMRLASPALDLCYFFYVNLDPDFFLEHKTEFLQYYLNELVNNTKDLRNLSANLTMEWLEAEMKTFAPFGLICGLWIMPIFFIDVASIDKNFEAFEENSKASLELTIENMSSDHKERVLRFVRAYVATLS